ncbi:MAG: glycine cleavage system protein R [Rhodoferax sp.]|nr:glycine cleavage system protein R [Rhodoferax sp.]
MSAIVVTLIGPDRPGVVRAISDKAAEHGANWTDSVMANFAGQFAGIVHLQVPAANSAALLAALRALESDDLHVQVAQAQDAAPAPAPRRLHLSLVGHDRPGIIHSISTRLAGQGVSIDTMKTHIASGAMSGEQMFHLDAQLTVPQDLDADTLRDGLEGLANELMVDIEFDSADGQPTR